MTSTLQDVEIDPVTGKPKNAHIIKPKDGRPGPELVTEARIFGYEVEALCGIKFVPNKNPREYPACQECVELFKRNTGSNGLPQDA